MYVGKTLFAQLMEFVPWTSFARIVQRHRGNSGVRALSCAEQFRARAFAQLTWRESLATSRAASLPMPASCTPWASARRSGARRRQHGLCPGLQHHRPVLEPVLVGAVPLHQGGYAAPLQSSELSRFGGRALRKEGGYIYSSRDGHPSLPEGCAHGFGGRRRGGLEGHRARGGERWPDYRASELACRVLASVKGSPLRLPLRQLE